MHNVRLMTLNPGHFHAALVQKEMYPGVARRVDVYAPLGPDLLAHLGRLAGFNARPDKPTTWEVEVHAGPDPLTRMLADRPGNVVVLSGRNRTKIDAIVAAVGAGLNVLADKPWIIAAADLPRLQSALDTAERNGVVASDIMTERYEISSILQRALVGDPDVFGQPVTGTPEEPGVFMESVHYLMKTVAGVPNRRPAWFFDVEQQGEGLTDVGTHLVDLVTWILFPERPLDYLEEVEVSSAKRWPTVLSRVDFQRVTGEPDFPAFLGPFLSDGKLDYFCNTLVTYAVRGVWVKLNVLWDFEASAGSGDTHFAVFRGSRARVEVRQGRDQNYRPELYVVPNAREVTDVAAAVRRRVEALQAAYPGVEVRDLRAEMHVAIPDRYRTGHEAHFGEVTRRFLEYLGAPHTLPAWEKPNMLAKYHVTTHGVSLASPHPTLSPIAGGEGRVRGTGGGNG